MSDNTRIHLNQSRFERINAVLALLLTAAVTLFVLSLTIKTGYSLVNSLAPEQAQAAPAATATATAAVTATQLPPTTPPTAVPPTPPRRRNPHQCRLRRHR